MNPMKKLLSICMISVSIGVQAQDVNINELYGAWTVNFDETYALILNSGRSIWNNMPEESRQKIQSVMLTQTLELDTLAQFSYDLGGYELNGTWSLEEDDVLLFETNNTPLFGQYIHDVGDDYLIIQQHDEQDTLSLFHYLYFDKLVQP